MESSTVPRSILSVPGLVLAALLLVSLRSLIKRQKTRTNGPRPPGPRGLPILGIMFEIPTYKIWYWYKEICDRYGDVVYFEALGQSFLVLGSEASIVEFLEKRSANTSDRQQTPMVELTGSGFSLALMPYGDWWRRHRRLFWQHLNQSAVVQYRGDQRGNVHKFLERLLKDPAALTSHIRRAFTDTIVKVGYGIETPDDDNTYLTMGEEAIEGVVEGFIPGKFLVEYLPFLRYVPTWFPGATSQRLFAKWMAASEKLKHVPYEVMKATISKRAEVSNSVTGQLYTNLTSASEARPGDEEEVIKNVGAVMYEAGADTTFGTLQVMFLALSLYPEVVKKAQMELDAVVGPDRMPDFDDMDSLVYINAILRETMRWQSIVPFALPHKTTADDELRGYSIPAGTVVIPNVWACMHDPEAYEDPEEFRPERFIRDGKIDPNVRDPINFVFGFGRRICPGRHLAHAGLYLNAASVLHVFNISAPLDENGKPIKVVPDMTGGFLSYPVDCRCDIKPRSARAEALIREYARLAKVDADV